MIIHIAYKGQLPISRGFGTEGFAGMHPLDIKQSLMNIAAVLRPGVEFLIDKSEVRAFLIECAACQLDRIRAVNQVEQRRRKGMI